MFRRRRKSNEDAAAEATDEAALETATDAEEPVDDGPADVRADGPWDVSEVDADEREGRIDLGGMLIRGQEGLELQAQYDEATGTVGTVTLLLGGSALQVQPFAAPRRAGIWDGVRQEIAASISSQGGTATEKEGPFGIELRAQVPVALPDGSTGAQLARFVGVDGPRWFLRGVITGDGYDDPAAAAPVEQIFRDIVVVRGDGPMGPREPIPLTLPTQAPAPVDEPAERPRDDLNPFERGPEITEVR